MARPPTRPVPWLDAVRVRVAALRRCAGLVQPAGRSSRSSPGPAPRQDAYPPGGVHRRRAPPPAGQPHGARLPTPRAEKKRLPVLDRARINSKRAAGPVLGADDVNRVRSSVARAAENGSPRCSPPGTRALRAVPPVGRVVPPRYACACAWKKRDGRTSWSNRGRPVQSAARLLGFGSCLASRRWVEWSDERCAAADRSSWEAQRLRGPGGALWNGPVIAVVCRAGTQKEQEINGKERKRLRRFCCTARFLQHFPHVCMRTEALPVRCSVAALRNPPA